MKTEITRMRLLTEYEQAPDNALFTQSMVAAIRACSLATIERDRWAGTGIPFVKIGRAVRYRKQDIAHWLTQYRPMQSTTQAQLNSSKITALTEVNHDEL